ncbi:Uncharacterised protein [Chryseobacterium nakagawai]|uniref:Amidophosphoribosyltransferase n=1 Tax=Chryseobacterium nakagawai TaxID=1241982 RepID=A0AAD0YL76_CHRNA|nr:amidophosphoribosyltransferase [Chryseobacterium nakagawai]AZA90549.1 amidophosphoribosyltransferase [Chryseobacterium nakagawai]VEH22057.1 Uncharacterised protein [Chryseobacterium nakagawai]
MEKFTIYANNFLNQNIQGYYHTIYTGMNNPGNPDYINDLKNTFNNFSLDKLNKAAQQLENVLMNDLQLISNSLDLPNITVCVVPRAKVNYSINQLRFKSTVKNVINRIDDFVDGTEYITRYQDTMTTHLKNLNLTNYTNNGSEPFPGITNETCRFSNFITNSNILLIDDIYTSSINIDEDAIQALYDNGARSVFFYSIGYRG